MKKPLMKALRWYYHLYYFLAVHRIQKNDLDQRSIHTLTVTVLSTCALMWAYAFLAYFTVVSPVPAAVGFICSFIHLFSPLLFRVTNNHFIIADILLASGLLHHMSFSYFTGGFMSPIMKWFPILPLLAGIICGKRGAIVWGIITTLVSLLFLMAHQLNYPFPNTITPEGVFWVNSLLQFGFILVCTIVMFISSSLQENTERILHGQQQKVDDLFKVLFHDLGNPLGRLGIGVSIARKRPNDPQTERGIEIIAQAQASMVEITQNVRKMYAISKGKADMDLVPTSLNESVQYLQQLFSHELSQKKITINYDAEINAKLKLLVEPVSFKNQVLGNILSNAIKFSRPESKIHISTHCVKPMLYAIEIKDEGVGIPKAFLPNLFNATKKTNRPGTHGEIGTGFGLQIMKSFVEMYGGAISVKSSEAYEGPAHPGTTFTLTLQGRTH